MTPNEIEKAHGAPSSHETLPSRSEAPNTPRTDVKSRATEVLGDDDEDAEGDGRVSESTSEDKSKQSQGSGKSKKAMTSDEIEILRAKLLATAPPPEQMQKEIRRVLSKQEHELTDELAKLHGKAHRNAYKMTIVMGQLRVVREYLNQLARATYEMVKHLWLKIVHGV